MRLGLFSQKKLHEALAGAGYDVSLRTVRRWIEGEATPNGAWGRAIREVLDIEREAAPPEWAERLLSLVELIALVSRRLRMKRSVRLWLFWLPMRRWNRLPS